MGSLPTMKKLSVIEGGPLDRLQLRLGLMKLQRSMIVRRALVFSLVAWLPLLILSVVQGTLLTNVRIPFLYDPSAHIRFLLSVPLSDRGRGGHRPADPRGHQPFHYFRTHSRGPLPRFRCCNRRRYPASRFHPCRSDHSRNYLPGRFSVDSVFFRHRLNLALISYRVGSQV